MSGKLNGSDTTRLTLVVEPNPEGHHLDYVGLIVDSCRSRGRRAVVLTTADAIESTQWSVHLGTIAPEVTIQPARAFSLADIARVATEASADLTIIPDGDKYLFDIFRKGWTGPGKLSVLSMRADGQPKKSIWPLRLRGIAKKALILGADLRPRVRVSALRSPHVRRSEPLHWIPDPVVLRCTSEERHKVRDDLRSHGDRYWVGVYGVITPRKNLPQIIHALLGQPNVPNIGLLIAGSIDEEVVEAAEPLLRTFDAAGGQVVHLSGTLTDAEFDAAIGAVDCVVVAYTNEGPSGIALRAAASGRRLVLAGAKSLNRDARYLGEQAIWSTLDVESLSRAIQQASSLPPPRESVVSVGAEAFLAGLT
ncbi:glycosyltransferase [Mycolicibacterium rhodesiae]|uniref:glycosyltransferase n=1 Tax=Mycolicibacterium rhodesiae TaxID=36814 RepID=UPI001056633A|nr:glycosyltransferase [Mycolicibacterium rhodesiae]MCV7345441.1 glycosyltransferase [Mycolicibacterium rhodesiae]